MNNNSAVGDLNSSSQRPNSATLDRAFRIIGKANVSPQSLGRKIRRSGATLAIGLIGTIVLLLTIRLDLLPGATAGAMSVFLLLASLAVVLMSGIAMSFTVWSAFVHQHVQLLEAKAEVDEVTRQLHVVLNSMEQAVPQHAAEAQSTAQQLEETVLEAQTVEQEAEVGQSYLGTVSRIVDFGAFVEIFPGIDGLLHITEIADRRVKDVRDELKEGQQILVKCIGKEGNKIKLSRKVVLRDEMHVELVDVQLVAAAARVSRVAPAETNELVEAIKRTITEDVQLQERAVSNTG